MARPIGTLGVIDTITIGGRLFTDITTLITLTGSGTTGYTTLRLPSGTAGYPVTAAKTFKVHATRCYGESAVGSASNISLGYGDNDVGYVGAAPTTPIYLGGGTVGQFSIIFSAVSATQGALELAFTNPFAAPAAKYLFVNISGNQGNAMIFGYET